jgi:hypothetical protein
MFFSLVKTLLAKDALILGMGLTQVVVSKKTKEPIKLRKKITTKPNRQKNKLIN